VLSFCFLTQLALAAAVIVEFRLSFRKLFRSIQNCYKINKQW